MASLSIGDVEQDSDRNVSCMYSFCDTLFDLSRHDDMEVLFSPTVVLCYFSVPFLSLTLVGCKCYDFKCGKEPCVSRDSSIVCIYFARFWGTGVLPSVPDN